MKTTVYSLPSLPRSALYVASFVAAIALAFTLGIAAVNAESNDTTAVKAKSELQISASGQVLLRNAKVTSVSNGTLGTTVSFGSTTLAVAVKTDSGTQFVRSNGRHATSSDVKVGDTINVSGSLDLAASTLTVKARVVKNLSLLASSTVKLNAEIESVSTTTNRLVVRTSSGTTTVAVTGGTLIKLDGATVLLASLSAGQNVQVIGTLNVSTGVVTAEKIIVSTDRDDDDDDDEDDDKKDKNDKGLRGYLKDLFKGNGPLKLKFNN